MKRLWRIFHEKYLQKRKLRFISIFYAKHQGKYCWSDCVSWSFSPSRFNPYKIESASGCRIESETHPSEICYCGGWSKGKCWDLLTKNEQETVISERGKERIEPIPF